MEFRYVNLDADNLDSLHGITCNIKNILDLFIREIGMILYKYVSFETGEKILEHNAISFTQPKYF